MKKNKEIKQIDGDYESLKTHLYSKKPLLGKGSPFSELLQNMVNKVLEGEMEDFIQEESKKPGITNKRNGKQKKRVKSAMGMLEIETPRDRNGDFNPTILKKRERSLTSGLDEQILALYAQGNSIEGVKRLLS